MREIPKKINLKKYENSSFEELDKKKNKLLDKCGKLWEKYGGKGTWEWYSKKCEPYWNDYDQVLCQWILKLPLEGVSTRQTKDCCGELFTIEHFKECCEVGVIFENDGEGYYVKESQEYDIPARPLFFSQGFIRPDFTHVIWYNK